MRTKRIVVFTSLLLACSSAAYGQKDFQSSGMFENKEEYGEFMGAAKRASAGNPELRALIPLINDIAQGRQIGSTAQQYGAAGSELGLLSDPRIREDLEMVDDQYRDLKDRQSEIQKRLASQLRAIDFSDSENVVGQIRELREEAEKDLNAVLLPHQVKRLRQIRMQALLRRRSLVDVLTSDPIRSDLEITEQQSEELRDYEKRVQEDLQKEISQLQEKARGRILSKLNRSQKSQAEEMIGDAFEFQPPSKGKLQGKSKGKDPGMRREKGKRNLSRR